MKAACYIVILTICCLQCCVPQRSTITWGAIHPGDRLLYRDVFGKPSSSFQKMTSDIVYVGYLNITGIRVLDESKNGNKGDATLLKGGLGSKNATIHLKSRRGQGFNFTVEIYGK